MPSIILRIFPKGPRPLLPRINRTITRQLRKDDNGVFGIRRLTTYPERDLRTIYSKQAMQPVGPYSQAVKTAHAIYCSGQLPADAGGILVKGSTAEKTRACLEALQAILKEAGSGLDRIVKVQIFLTDMADFAEMNEEYEKWIKHKPARSCVAVKQLPKDVNIEIECVALPGIGAGEPYK